MIVCDFCRKKKEKIDTVVLYSQIVDYCEDCEPIVNKLIKKLRKSINYYEEEKDKQIKEAELTLIDKFKYERKLNK